ncbi:MAG: TonB-dependent receptor, partial [Bryobacterales bacterium]|nr:TonB-dependent receptor [Bryobacterales bacterium]
MFPFVSNPRAWKPRKWFFQVHLYAGIVVGFLALVIGLSGAALVYSPELEVAPRWASASVSKPMALADLTRAVARQYPGFRVEDIRFSTAGIATQVHVKKALANDGGNGKAPGTDLQLVVDPQTGQVLKAVDRHTGVWNFLRDLHHDLLAGRTGRVVNGLGALALFTLCVTGMVIWWPGTRLWKQRVKVQSGTSWKRFNWDLHNAGGFWLAAGLAFFSFTGFQYAFPQVTKGALRWMTGSPERPKKPKLAVRTGGMADLDTVARQAMGAVPDGRLAQIKLPKKADEPFEVRMKTAFDGHHEGNNKVFLDGPTGDVLLVDRFDRLPLASRAIELLEPLHNARFMTLNEASVLARAPWIVMGLAPGFLFLTGFLMWWNRVVSKKLVAVRSQAARVELVKPARAAGIAILLFMAQTQLHAQLTAEQNVLSGLVLDPAGAAVAGAKITLRISPERTARSQADGRFEFLNVAPGEYPASVEAAGFTSWFGTLKRAAGTEVRLEVAAAVESITVNAGTLEEQRLEEPLMSTSIGRADIASRNNRRLSDVVARMPGVFLTGPPGGEKDIRVRGLDKEYARTQVDGVMIPDGGEKRELQLNRIPSSVVDSVRLIRNPTAEFESDGLAGRVDVQTRPIPEGLHVDGRLGYGARGARTNSVAQGQLSAGWRFSRRFGFMAGYNYIDDHLPIDRNRLLSNRNTEVETEQQNQRSGNFFGNFGVYTDRLGTFHVKPVVMDFLTGMERLRTSENFAGALLNRTGEAEDKSQRTRGLSLTHQYARSNGLVWDTQAAFFRSTEGKDKLATAFKVSNQIATLDKRTPELETKADQTWNFASAAAVPFQFGVWNELKFGAAARMRDRFRDKSKYEIDLAGRQKDVSTPKDRYNLTEDYQAFFVQDRFRFTERFSIMPGLRIERVTLDAGNPLVQADRRVFVDVNPSTHLLYRVRRNVSLHAAVSRGLARPKFDELSPFEVASATKIVVGNPDLDPARAWNYDAGVDYATSRVSFSVNAFRKTIRGVIEEVDTLENRGTVDIYQVRNAGNGWLRGIEFEQRLRMPQAAPVWMRAFSVWSNQTLISSRLLAASGLHRPFKEQPRWIANVGLDFNNDERSGTSMSVISNFTARRFDYKTSGDVTGKGGSSNFDMAVYQRVRGNWRLFAEMNNLMNRDRSEDEMFVNGTVNRRVERYGRTAL